MGVDKSELKMAVAHELGSSFDDALEAAERDIYRWDGAKTSLTGAATAVEALMSHVKKDLDEAKLTEDEAKLSHKWLHRAVEVVRNLKSKAEVYEQRAHGRADAMRTSVKIAKALYDNEAKKITALASHVEEAQDGEVRRRPSPRPTGTRPANKIAALKVEEVKSNKRNGKKAV